MRENSGTLEEAVSIRAADKVFNPDSDNEVQALLGIDLDVKKVISFHLSVLQVVASRPF